MTTLNISRGGGLLEKDPTTEREFRGPSPPPDRYSQPGRYTIVFTDARRAEPPAGAYTGAQLTEMRRKYSRMLLYNAVVGQNAETKADTGEIVAVKDRLSFVRAAPYNSRIRGYVMVDEVSDRNVATSEDERALVKSLERTIGKKNLDLIGRRLNMEDVRVVFEPKDGLYVALFPVDTVPALHDYIGDPNAPVPQSREEFQALKRTLAEHIGRMVGIPHRSVIIPTLSRQPFPHTTVAMNDLRRMRNLQKGDFSSRLECYGMLEELFEDANGTPDQFLPFDRKLVQVEYRSWPVMNF